MQPRNEIHDRIAQKITLVTLVFLACIGAIMVFVPIRPFWVDEWFIIYNLKTKDFNGLRGKLELMQQFPRAYLLVFKFFTSAFDYRYFSLRLPSYVVGMSTIFLSLHIIKRIYSDTVLTRYLFVLILVSSFTFTKYFVETKQYSMDVFLSVLTLWQLLEVLQLGQNPLKGRKYGLVCMSFLLAPFFSYTYPLAVFPVYMIALLRILKILRSSDDTSAKYKKMILVCFPLLLCSISLYLFYIFDLKQLMADGAMHGFWSFLMIDKSHLLTSFLTTAYTLFSQLGSGLIFETIFGIVGIISFLYGAQTGLIRYMKKEESIEIYLLIYCFLLVSVSLALFLLGFMPIGTPRLNAYTVPSITILIIYITNKVSLKVTRDSRKLILPAILYLGTAGNVFSVFINYFSGPIYKKQMIIYNATEKAIQQAQTRKIPILITKGYTYPYEGPANPDGAPEPGIWALKTFPSYLPADNLQVYAISDLDHAEAYLQSMPDSVHSALVGDGVNFREMGRK